MSSEPTRVSAHASQSTKKQTEHRLRMYSAAAIAAGVGALAMAQPAEAEVVITRKTIPIPRSDYFLPPPHPVYISLNNNGVRDFSFYLYSFAYHGQAWDLTVRPLERGGVQGGVSPQNEFYASALVRGAKIGPSAHFSSSGGSVLIEREDRDFNYSNSTSSWRTFGDWGKNQSNTYLGVKFRIDGQTHYGWVRLTVSSGVTGIEATIIGYAYETEPNKQILAGVPKGSDEPVRVIDANGPSLGALAAGADGLQRWRKDQPVVH